LNILYTDDSLDWNDRQVRLLRIASAFSLLGFGIAVACPSRSILRNRLAETDLRAFDIDFDLMNWFDAARALRTLERRATISLIHVSGERDARACLPLHLTGTPILRDCNDAKTFLRFGLFGSGCSGIFVSEASIRNALVQLGIAASRVLAPVGPSEDAYERMLLEAYRKAAGRQ